MARSNVVYVVLDGGYTPIKGFTVKHELKTWLDRNGTHNREVWRLGDGLNSSVAELDPETLERWIIDE